MDADTISYLRTIGQHSVHRVSPMARQASAVFDELLSEGLIRVDQEGYFRITKAGKRLKVMLVNFRKRFGSTASKDVEKALREEAKRG